MIVIVGIVILSLSKIKNACPAQGYDAVIVIILETPYAGGNWKQGRSFNIFPGYKNYDTLFP